MAHCSAPIAAALLLITDLGPSSRTAEAKPPEVLAEATLDWDYRPRRRIVVDQRLWRCIETVCTAQIIDTPYARHRACYRLARHFGRVLRFETPSGPASQDDLARCNHARRWRED